MPGASWRDLPGMLPDRRRFASGVRLLLTRSCAAWKPRRLTGSPERHWADRAGISSVFCSPRRPRSRMTLGSASHWLSRVESWLSVGSVPARRTVSNRRCRAKRSAADNGFTADGELNCCANDGCCETDADCCGDLRCAVGYEICPGFCTRPPIPTRAVGQVCTSNYDCFSWPGCFARCEDQRCTCTVTPALVTEHPDAPDIPDSEAALAVAEMLSGLEVAGSFRALYDGNAPRCAGHHPPRGRQRLVRERIHASRRACRQSHQSPFHLLDLGRHRPDLSRKRRTWRCGNS